MSRHDEWTDEQREPRDPEVERGLKTSRRMGADVRRNVELLRERQRNQTRCPERARQPKAVSE